MEKQAPQEDNAAETSTHLDNTTEFEENLVEDVLRGEKEAVSKFLKSYLPLFRSSIIRTHLRSKGSSFSTEWSVEDLTQEIILALVQDNFKILRTWKSIHGISLKTYLYRFCVQRIIDFQRKMLAAKRNLPPGDQLLNMLSIVETNQELAYDEKEYLRNLSRILSEELAPPEQELFKMTFIEERSSDDICQTLGISSDTFYQRRVRLRMRIAALSSKLGPY